MTDRRKSLKIDTCLESYDVLMKDPAGDRLLEAGKGLRIEAAVDDLAISWRMTDHARNLPHLLVTTINSVAAAASGTTGDSVPAQMMCALVKHLDGKLDRTALRKVEAAVERLHKKLRLAGKRIIDTERKERAKLALETWTSFLKLSPFTFALAGSEGQAYSSLYFAYECFLSALIEVRTGVWPETTGALADTLRAQLGPDDFKSFWSDRPIEAARHARDAIAHRGGRVQQDRVLSKNGKVVKRWATSDFVGRHGK